MQFIKYKQNRLPNILNILYNGDIEFDATLLLIWRYGYVY